MEKKMILLLVTCVLFLHPGEGSSLPDAFRNLTQLITNQGYPVERYVVQTLDGFLLDLHRIPHGRLQAHYDSKRKSYERSMNVISSVFERIKADVESRDTAGFQRSKTKELEDRAMKTKTRLSGKRMRKKKRHSTEWQIAGNYKNYRDSVTGSTKPAVFLQHGYMSAACDFVMNFANGSLAFVLADAGYDVWLGNSRGNTYSRKHVTLSPNDTKFWDWSFDEMAQYDTPAFIDFILNKTSQPSLYYIGHSQGTMIAFALLSQQQEYRDKIRLFVGLAPIMSLTHMKSPMRYLAEMDESFIYSLLGHSECFLNTNKSKHMADTTCAHPETRWLCDAMLFLTNGPDVSNLNQTRLPVYMSHTPAGTSVKNVVHYAQMVRQKRFAKYDYGSPDENIRKYGQPIPPAYNVSTFRIPALLFTASRDWLADPRDVSVLESTLPNILDKYNYPTWNHMDFVLGMNTAELCYSEILKRLPQF